MATWLSETFHLFRTVVAIYSVSSVPCPRCVFFLFIVVGVVGLRLVEMLVVHHPVRETLSWVPVEKTDDVEKSGAREVPTLGPYTLPTLGPYTLDPSLDPLQATDRTHVVQREETQPYLEAILEPSEGLCQGYPKQTWCVCVVAWLSLGCVWSPPRTVCFGAFQWSLSRWFGCGPGLLRATAAPRETPRRRPNKAAFWLPLDRCFVDRLSPQDWSPSPPLPPSLVRAPNPDFRARKVQIYRRVVSPLSLPTFIRLLCSSFSFGGRAWVHLDWAQGRASGCPGARSDAQGTPGQGQR